MVDLTRSIPPHSPAKTDAERFCRLRDAVVMAALNHTISLSEFRSYYVLFQLLAMVSIFAALQLIEYASNAWAWWACCIAFVVLTIEMIFNPTKRALWHCVRASKLSEVGTYMNDETILTDTGSTVKWWRQKAKNAGLDHSEL